MNKIKKTILTLVALLAVTTGAWAQGPWTSGDCTLTLSDGVLTVSGTGAMADYESYNDCPWYGTDIQTIVIENGVTSIGTYAFESCSNLESVSIPASVTSIGTYAFEDGGSNVEALTVSFAEGSTPLTIGQEAFHYANLKSIDIPNRVTSIGRSAFSGCSNLESVSIPASVTSISEEAFWGCGMLANVYIYAPSLTTYGLMAFQENAAGRKIHVLSDAVDTYKAGWPDYAADFVGDLQPLASGPEVAWDKAKKSGSFTMPGGNVTLEPEYYPQATVADGGVTAADADARATTDDPLVKVDATKLTGATKLMYFVSNSGTTAPAYDAEGWTDQLPTAEGFTQQGIVYVWYYPVGTDEGVDGATATYSDGDICLQSITARIAAAPTYAVTFADGVNPEPPAEPEWTASPNTGVKKGQTVTVTYSGSKKVIGVKAEKKAPVVYTMVSEATAADYGKVVCAAGHLHDAKTAVPEGCTAVAVFAYIDGGNKRMGIALQDAENATWNMITTDGAYNNTLCAVPGTWNVAAPTDAEWFVGTKEIYEAIFTNLGSTTSHVNGKSYDDNVNAFITTGVGGTALSDVYWCTTSKTTSLGWKFSGIWSSENKTNTNNVRPVLGF